MQNEYEIKKEMCEIGKRVYNRGMVAANDGNFQHQSCTAVAVICKRTQSDFVDCHQCSFCR